MAASPSKRAALRTRGVPVRSLAFTARSDRSCSERQVASEEPRCSLNRSAGASRPSQSPLPARISAHRTGPYGDARAGESRPGAKERVCVPSCPSRVPSPNQCLGTCSVSCALGHAAVGNAATATRHESCRTALKADPPPPTPATPGHRPVRPVRSARGPVRAYRGRRSCGSRTGAHRLRRPGHRLRGSPRAGPS